MPTEPSVIKEPKLYDLFNYRCTEDIPMYASLFQHVNTILELGVGTGRLAIPLAEKGFDVVGVDISTEMLDHLRGKLANVPEDVSSRIKTVHQDFCHLDLDGKFDCACYPFCTFNYLLTVEQQVNALKALHKHLNEGVLVVFDLMTIHTFKDMLYKTDIVPYDTTHDAELDLDVLISTQGSYNQATQIFSQERFFRYYTQNDSVLEKRVRMDNRIILFGEFQLLLEKCGYRIKEYYGSYNLTKFNSYSQCLIVVATLDK